jgi:hypothetical protein
MSKKPARVAPVAGIAGFEPVQAARANRDGA